MGNQIRAGFQNSGEEYGFGGESKKLLGNFTLSLQYNFGQESYVETGNSFQFSGLSHGTLNPEISGCSR